MGVYFPILNDIMLQYWVIIVSELNLVTHYVMLSFHLSKVNVNLNYKKHFDL